MVAGAGLLNGIFLARASGVIEVRPLGFDATQMFTWPAWFENRFRVYHEVMYFSICIYDENLSIKSPLEGVPGTHPTARDRSVILPAMYLLAVLDKFIGLNGNITAYDNLRTTKLCTQGWQRLQEQHHKPILCGVF